ncbi:long-chain-fatty-acid--CoA ligase [Chelativorans sp. Marseille-P2723]|uniref:long-chain-fatty-acid--CoA ligase n=1 Tax=Chelativorans sp. Marseille-P2723 TaxID=2709133 RepID=UPI0024849914|nr:long-chain-fatty-acid--CoA ligase [Chelativorans sp. Marseille-P2723]
MARTTSNGRTDVDVPAKLSEPDGNLAEAADRQATASKAKAPEGKRKPRAAATAARAEKDAPLVKETAKAETPARRKTAKATDEAKPAKGGAATKSRRATVSKRRAETDSRTKSRAAKTPAKTANIQAASGSKAVASRARSSTGARRSTKIADKPWLKTYPESIAAEIGPFRHSSLADMMLEACRVYADRPAFTLMDKTLTFAELEKASRDFAAYLQSLGLEKGARVAIMMPNVLQYPVAMMAALRAGYAVVNVNPLYTERELEHQLRDSGAEAIVILENFAHTLQNAMSNTSIRHIIVASMGDMMGLKGHVVNFVIRRMKKLVPEWSLPHTAFRRALKEGGSMRFSPPEVTLDDLAFLQYTGGTTGTAKGAMLLHRNVLANAMQCDIWFSAAYHDKQRPEREVYLAVLPLYHIYALTVNALMGIQLGTHNILIPNPRDIPSVIKEFSKYRVNVLPGLNTLFNALLNHPDFQKLDFKDLELTFGGGMAVQRSVADRWKKLTGCKITEGYGLSETSPVATANRFDTEEFTGSIGLPIPSTDVAIRDDEGQDVGIGEVGEICIRGPQVMAGYWNRPEETKGAMTSDGYFRSGDMGMMDKDGYIRIVDRKKDMIIVSGFNVYPNEIEDVVAQHPGVREVAVVGVPDEHSGEVPKLFVVRNDPNVTEEELLTYCREKLTGYKRPKSVEFRDELPKSNVGKILRRELR